MSGVRTTPLRSGKYQGWFTEYTGKRRFFVGTRNKRDTLLMAQKLEDEHRQVRLGYRPVPSPTRPHQARAFAVVVQEYLAWGTLQGGIQGRPWSAKHAETRAATLAWWHQTLHCETVGDLDGCLPAVEQALQRLATTHSGKTLSHYLQSLKAFCRWCVERDYLETHPLTRHAPLHTRPRTTRRALTADEIRRVLAVCPRHQRFLIEVAFLSGLRARELRSLTVDDLDPQRQGVWLRADVTKNRQAGFQPLPARLVQALTAFVASGEAARRYDQTYRRTNSVARTPSRPLLYVPVRPAQALYPRLRAAHIPQQTAEGRVDFHALRVAYITCVVEAGATVKEAQTLARHASPQLTMGVYARSRPHQLQAVVETVDQALFPPLGRVPSVHAQVVGMPAPTGPADATPPSLQAPRLPPLTLIPGRHPDDKQEYHQKPLDVNDRRNIDSEDVPPTDRFETETMRALSVHGDLQAWWASLPETLRHQIAALVAADKERHAGR